MAEVIQRSRSTADSSLRPVAYWLLAVAALVFVMVVVGGVTRLTESGLSMVEWRPLMGALPPLDEAAWRAVFAKYQLFPEYQTVNRGMTLDEFKGIFWLEYVHRLLGRAIGVAFLLPLLWFLIRRRIPRALAPKLVLLFVLGGLQGLLGWYMVKSGLVDQPDVSAYRLAAHLGLAIVIYGAILWTALGLLARPARHPDLTRPAPAVPAGLRIGAWVATGLVFVTIISGAFVAGNDAGLAYNSFPLMAGAIVPPDIFLLEPAWRNFFETVPLVQLDHRLLAMLTVLTVLVLWGLSLRARLPAPARHALHAMAAAAVCQLGLGIATLLTYVPVPLGAAHQTGALVTLTVGLLACHALSRPGAPVAPGR